MTRPEVVESRQTESKVILRLYISPKIIYFEGHLPNFALLPGVVQIDWAYHLALNHFSIPPSFQGMDRIKFAKPIFPDSLIDLELEYQPAKGQLSFTYLKDSERYSSGVLYFEP